MLIGRCPKTHAGTCLILEVRDEHIVIIANRIFIIACFVSLPVITRVIIEPRDTVSAVEIYRQLRFLVFVAAVIGESRVDKYNIIFRLTANLLVINRER